MHEVFIVAQNLFSILSTWSKFWAPINAFQTYVPSYRNYCLKVFYVSNTLLSAYQSVPWSQTDISNYSVKSHLSGCQFCIFCPGVKQRQRAQFAFEYLVLDYVSWITILRKFNTHINEPMFPVSSHSESVWLGFELLKVGQLSLL